MADCFGLRFARCRRFPADLEEAAGCFQAPRVAALLEAADKSRGVRITAPYHGPPEGS